MTENTNTAVDVMGLSEAEALALVNGLADKFGWRIPKIWTRADADYVVEGLTDGLRGITDAEWEQVRVSELWLEQVNDVSWERGCQWAADAVYDAVSEVVPRESAEG